MARGGRRSGSPGAAYANRTDLNGGAALPAMAATGQPYGQAGQQLAAQQAIPIQTQPSPVPAGPLPGELTALHAPSERPNEPVTHGVSVGPGAGPEILPQPMSPVLKGLAILNSAGTRLTPELAQVARFLNVTQSNGMGQ
jgi:hypothetical protein